MQGLQSQVETEAGQQHDIPTLQLPVGDKICASCGDHDENCAECSSHLGGASFAMLFEQMKYWTLHLNFFGSARVLVYFDTCLAPIFV